MRRYSFYTLATLLVAGVAITSCTSDDFADEALTPQQGKTYTLTVNATKGADTRTLTESEGALTAAWNAEDEVDVYKGTDKVGTLKPTAAGATKLKGEVTDVAVDDVLTLKFQSDADYTSQEGTLDYIDTHCSAGVATVTIEKIEGSEIYTSDATFENRQSITKFTFSETVSKVIISGGAQEITVTPASDTKTLYVAIPATTGEADFTFTATVEGKTYTGSKSATLKNGFFYTATISLDALADYIDLSAEETANTYMVTKAGNYKFKATVKGNGGIDPVTGETAKAITGIAGVKVLWELWSQGRAIKHNGSAYDIFYSDGYVYFSTPDPVTSGGGDAYVAVYDSEGTILWSWLIWTTDTPSETTYDGLTIMDRNLAAIGTGDVQCRGLMYEWGRKDPFPSPNNGSYTPNSFVPTNRESFSIISVSEEGKSVAYSVENPTTYFGWWSYAYWQIESEWTPYMWWSNAKTIYDPCPPGWKVPSKDEMKTVVNSGVNLPGNGFIGNAQKPFTSSVYGNPGSLYYWTSTAVDRNHAWGWYGSFSSTHVDNHIASAYSIRPVRDVKVSDYLVQYWPFNGDTKNAVAGGVDAVNSGATLTTDRHGKENSAYYFNGSAKMVASGAANFGTSSFTANVWVCSSQTSGSGNLMRTDGGYYQGWLLRFNNGSLEIWEGRSNNYAFVSTQKFSDGNWHMVTYVRDVEQKAGKLYVDGENIGGYQMTGTTINDVTNELRFGTYGDGEYYTGKIDDARLFNKALTDLEINALYIIP